MALMTPVSDDAAIFEYSYTMGSGGPYVLAGAWGSHKRFSNRFITGNTVLYRVTDGSANTEYCTGTYDSAANTLTRTVLDSTNGGAAINWSGRTRLMVHPLVQGIPLCATPPTAGQALLWDAVNNEWCPGDVSGGGGLQLCATPPWDGADLVWNAANSDWCPDSRIFGMPGGANGGAPSASSDVTLTAADQSGGGDAGRVNITAGNVEPASGLAGGEVNITSGSGDPVSGSGGIINIIAGPGGALGGFLNVTAGDTQTVDGSGTGGTLTLAAGGSVFTAGTGGQANLDGGNGQFQGGRVEVSGGGAFDGSGGDAGLSGGSAGDGGIGDSGIGGTVIITGGSGIGGGDSGNIVLSMSPVLSGAGQMGVIQIAGFASGNIPTVNPAPHNFLLYVNPAGHLEIRGSAGTITTLAVP